MKSGAKTVVCVLGSLAVTAAAHAIVNEEGADNGNPYRVIIERNVFDLKAPAPPVSIVPTNAPPPNVKLTGITSILGKRQALFLVQKLGIPGKTPNTDVPYIITEGERQDSVEVLEINEKAETVKIKNDGNVSVLKFEKLNLPNTPGAGVPPGLPGPGGGVPRMPNYVMPAQPAPINQQAANYGNAGGYNPGSANNNNGLTTIPTRTLRTSQDAQGQEPELSQEQAALLLELQREATKDAVAAGKLPPLPPPAIPLPTDVPASGTPRSRGNLPGFPR
jgi:hypothetical protein